MLIYRALEWKPPVIAHLPVILGNDGKKLSKRHGATFCKIYREEGYLPDALINYLLLQGWSPGEGSDNKEIFTREEMIADFSLERVKAAASVFSFEKLKWMNGVYMRQTPNEELARLTKPFLTATGLQVDDTRLREIMPYVRERMLVSLKDALPFVEFLFVDRVDPDLSELVGNKTSVEDVEKVLKAVITALQKASPFTPGNIETELRGLSSALGISTKIVFMTVRIAVTGRKATPPLFESLAILGQERTIARLTDALTKVSTGVAPSR
jgi:glutamyl-tRNA synthetase